MAGLLARAAYAAADNMTESFGSLAILLDIGAGEAELADFAAKWQHDRLVLDKWFAVQVAAAAPENVADVVRRLTERRGFRLEKPQPLPRGDWRALGKSRGVPP